jgi:Raf kinase inhibitor-like YbhB/YbcL family protein
MPLTLASPAIPPGGEIPTQYTCDGADISPPLAWSGVPDGTKSFILVVDDPDAPSGVFHHWAVFDMPSSMRELNSGYGRSRPATSLHEARNDFGKPGYGAPCPPKGHGVHHYRFRLLAISRPTLDLNPSATAPDVLKAAEPYILQRAELVGTYRR